MMRTSKIRPAATKLRTVQGVICALLISAVLQPAYADPTVEKDGDNVSAIRDLEVGSLLYDVEFFNYAAPSIYGDPPEFDFASFEEATVASRAVNAVLNAEGGVRLLGRAADTGLPYFRVGYNDAVKEIDVDLTFGPIDIHIHREVRIIATVEGTTEDPDAGSTTWVLPGGAGGLLALDSGNYAQFTVVGSAGSGNAPPVADAGGPYVGAVGGAIRFDGSGSQDPGGSIATYEWAFGDETTGTGATPEKTYTTPGLYHVTLTVTDADGATASDVGMALIGSVSEPPVADARGPYQGTVGAVLSFDGTASIDPDGTIASYHWDFGDDTTGTGATPDKTYAEDGRYAVILTVTDDSGETASDATIAAIGIGNQPPVAAAGAPVAGVSGTEVTFDGTASDDVDGSIASYAWDFGDDATGTGATPSHTYDSPGIYTVILTVTDDSGATDSSVTAAGIDEFNQPPLADAKGPYTGTAGVAVDFDGSGSSDSDGSILAMVWDFGDGRTGAGATPSNAYAEAGTYNVTLTVIDDDGATTEDYATVAVDSPNQPPVADADGPYAGVAGAPVTFNGTATDDPDGEIQSIVWDFGDGSEGNGDMPLHTYTAAGRYEVTLTVTDNDGATDTVGTLAVIGDGSRPPTADANGPYLGEVGVPVAFDGTGSSEGSSTYSWDFGDNSSSTDRSPTHTYSAAGIYNVTLTVTDDQRVPASDSSTAVIGENSDPPSADAGGPYGGTVGAAVSFDGTSSVDPDGTIASYDWDFGDGGTGTGPTPTHTFANDGAFTVSLTVTDDSGEADSDLAQADIGIGNQAPQADAGGPYTAPTGATVLFDGTGSSDPDGTVASYAWEFGDGSTGTGPTPSHTYESGLYIATLTVTDDDGAVDSHGTAIDVLGDIDGDGTLNVDDTDNDNDTIKDKNDVDKDGDGWDFALERAAGTSDLNPHSVPAAGEVGDVGPGVKKLTVTLNFKKSAHDKLLVEGTVPVAEHFCRNGAAVSFDFDEGALTTDHTLDANGSFKASNYQVTFSRAKEVGETGKFVSTFKFKAKKQDFAELFPQLVNEKVKGIPVGFTFGVTLMGKTFTNHKTLTYTAKPGKNGTAKQPKAPK